MEQKLQITPADLENFKRLDIYLASKLPQLTRSLIKDLFQKGKISSTEKIQLKKMPKLGTIIQIDLEPVERDDLIPQEIPLDIIFEDEFLLIINKPPGLVVHPGAGQADSTLVNALLYYCGEELRGIGGEKRPGIVHRIDKGTSGLMVVAKEQTTHSGLVKLFSTHDIHRRYLAIVSSGKLVQEKTIETMFGRHPKNRIKMSSIGRLAKSASTTMRRLDQVGEYSLVELRLKTGRTHQIRVHLSEQLKAPILNDHTYGNPNRDKQKLPPDAATLLGDYEFPLLHASELGFIHPKTQQELFFKVEPPALFCEILKLLNLHE